MEELLEVFSQFIDEDIIKAIWTETNGNKDVAVDVLSVSNIIL